MAFLVYTYLYIITMRRVFVIRKDLHLTAGKLAAMVAHCAEGYWMRLLSENLTHTLLYEDGAMHQTKDYCTQVTLDGDIVDNYINGSFTKTICEARNLNQLMKAETIAKELGLVEGIDYGFIDDNCLTELTPEFIGEDGKPHCRVGIWFKPLEDESAHKISKAFKLYRD